MSRSLAFRFQLQETRHRARMGILRLVAWPYSKTCYVFAWAAFGGQAIINNSKGSTPARRMVRRAGSKILLRGQRLGELVSVALGAARIMPVAAVNGGPDRRLREVMVLGRRGGIPLQVGAIVPGVAAGDFSVLEAPEHIEEPDELEGKEGECADTRDEVEHLKLRVIVVVAPRHALHAQIMHAKEGDVDEDGGAPEMHASQGLE